MAAQRAAEDPDITTFEASVESIQGREVVLDTTYFFAESGGQPADRGTIDDIPVVDVQRTASQITHTLAENPNFEEGDRIAGYIDATFRTYCRRAHSASHVLYGAAREHLADLGYGGFDIAEDKVRIDFETSSRVDDATLVDLERAANRAVWESRPVTWMQVPLEEVEAQSGVAFNTKTEEGVFDEAEDVRIVEIGASTLSGTDGWWDRAACGGTHVRNTHEIGPIAVIERSNPGEGLTRVELTVGERAVDHQARMRTAAMESAQMLDVAIEDLPDRATQLRTDLEDLESTLADLHDRVIAAQVSNQESIDREGSSWLITAIEEVDGDALGRYVRDTEIDTTDVIVLLTTDRPAQLVVGTNGSVDASNIVSEITDTFGGGGGGGDVFAQGGGIDADPADVLAYLRE